MLQVSENNVVLSYEVTLHTWHRTQQSRFSTENIYPHKVCTQMFTAALFVIAPNWEQLRCPLMGEWIKKLVHPCNGNIAQP